MKKPVDFQRRRPKQARAQVTVDSILEAAVQVLERSGAAGLNTNSVAERAGVSIGTLYQYFPDKEAILLALARRELSKPDPAFATLQKALMDALIRAFEALLGKSSAARAGGSGRQVQASAKGISDSRLKFVGQHLKYLLTPSVPILQPVFVKTRR